MLSRTDKSLAPVQKSSHKTQHSLNNYSHCWWLEEMHIQYTFRNFSLLYVLLSALLHGSELPDHFQNETDHLVIPFTQFYNPSYFICIAYFMIVSKTWTIWYKLRTKNTYGIGKMQLCPNWGIIWAFTMTDCKYRKHDSLLCWYLKERACESNWRSPTLIRTC